MTIVQRSSPASLRTALIAAAFGRGASDPGCAAGPARLRDADLAGRLAAAGVAAEWLADIGDPVGEPSPMAAAADVAAQLATACGAALAVGRRPVVIGGDHSCAVGTWSGVARGLRGEGRLGLIWIDAHLDSHTPATSHTGMIHGMPVAALLGHGDPRLTGIAGGMPALRPEDLCIVGARDYEPEEPEFLAGQGVRVFFAEEVRARGLPAVMDEALTRVRAGTAAFGVSLDLDAVDPGEAPGVGCRVADGLTAADLVAAVEQVRSVAEPIAWELVEFNPRRDIDGRTAALAMRLLESALR
ncbi:arginase [Constrictibacter sp. MBR-5]|jgi:arginase|uniref:arginase n=1 Tax=Constrictibacter sp. MBR-5 TaxID=3156467 RepID=UPI003390D412